MAPNCLLRWQLLFALSVVAISTAAAYVKPVAPFRSSFLGAGLDENGVFSLAFSGTAMGEVNQSWVMTNTLISGQPDSESRYIRHANTDHVLRTVRQQNSTLTTAAGDYVEWEVETPGVVAVRVKFSASSLSNYKQTFSFSRQSYFYGIWEYPWDGAITNNRYGANTSASTAKERKQGRPTSDIGIYGTQPGINWSNARAPFFFTDNGIGVYVDTDAPVMFSFQEDDTGVANATITSQAASLSYRVLFGQDNVKSLLGQFAKLSSYPYMPTESAYGPIFWSDDFEQDFHGSHVRNAQDNINDVAGHLDESKIRATAFFADRPYGSGNWSFGNFDFDPKFYPNPAGFIANLTLRGYDFQVWTANRAFLYTQLYNDSASNHWLYPDIDPVQYLGPALNLSIPAAYSYFRDKMTTFVSDMGIRGFKIDRGEEREMPDEEQNRQQSLFLKLCDEVMQAAVKSENSSHLAPAVYYNFARSAFDRDRSRVGIWNGDSQATFEGLRYSVASGIRAGLLGFSHWGSDTGGYVRDAGGPTEELFARWMHFSAWSPMYEIMVGLKHTPWYDYSPRLVSILRQTADVHTRLIPYLRSCAYEASLTGVPAMRALFLEYPEDGTIYETGDMYMLGSEFLVAPILEEGGSRLVRFPKTTDGGRRMFLDYNNKTAVFSPGEVHNISSLPLESTPVYVREGSIVPTGDIYRGNAVGWTSKNESGSRASSSWVPHLVIEVFPSFNVPVSTFTYYRGPEGVVWQGVSSTKKNQGSVTITVTTNMTDRTVTVQGGDFGVPTAVRLYQKSLNSPEAHFTTTQLSTDERTFVATGVYSLFE